MIEQVLGYVPMPEIEDGEHLISYLFDFGPIEGDGAVTWPTMDCWSRRMGIDLEPWQYQLMITMSRAYLAQSHESRHRHAIPPWPKARGMWKYVQDQRSAPSEPVSKQKKGQRNVSRK